MYLFIDPGGVYAPTATLPWVFAHTREVRIDENQFKPRTVDVSDIFWK